MHEAFVSESCSVMVLCSLSCAITTEDQVLRQKELEKAFVLAFISQSRGQQSTRYFLDQGVLPRPEFQARLMHVHSFLPAEHA